MQHSCAILYTPEQLLDLKRFCFSSAVAQDSVLSLYRQSTQDHPIFIGPMFIHGNSTQDDFSQFFAHLNSKLSDYPSAPIVGTDEETALRNAIQNCMPGAIIFQLVIIIFAIL